MSSISNIKQKKHICIALTAHVDAGKTTLSEALIYKAGMLREPGRVDHKNSFFDTDVQERNRGITIFSKQAELSYGNLDVTLLDTPGHVDFSAETERTFQVLDYAVLVVSGKDGVQGHTVTLWKLFEKYSIPVFIFVNKMDLDGTDKREIMKTLQSGLDDSCLDFTDNSPDDEELASNSEQLMDEYFEKETVEKQSIAAAIKKREIFPCYFGSALKLQGIDELITGMQEFTRVPVYGRDFAARVYKITRDGQGNRLTHMKITGGSLKVKDSIVTGNSNEEIEEKVNQIRIYSGEKYKTTNEVEAGHVCAVSGLEYTFSGQALGAGGKDRKAILEPALEYSVLLPDGYDPYKAFEQIKLLEDEDPQLHVNWNEQHHSIQLRIMGKVQLDVIKKLILDRFDIEVDFGEGNITYKETIRDKVIGSGHFEPLRHYAEVHLMLEPGEPGSGLVFDTICSEDELDRNWQRLILTHLAEREHRGILTGSPLTDIKITLIAGKAHLKHTEGGDFRQATYRALGQGIRKAEMILLEPWYEFEMEIPTSMAGRAMSDVRKMGGETELSETNGDTSILTGCAPVSEMKDYSIEVASYTKGHGRFSCNLCGYRPCHNQEEIVELSGYDSERDLENTGDSVFCTHGAGVNIKWNESDSYMHIKPESGKMHEEDDEKAAVYTGRHQSMSMAGIAAGSIEEEEELKRVLDKAYIAPKEKRIIPKRVIESKPHIGKTNYTGVLPEYLIVDGYNIIFAWEELKELAKVSIDGAREALIEILSNYQGYRKCNVIAVFDAYKVKGGSRHNEKTGDVEVVYTKESETADMYIERIAYEMKGKYTVRVATSDNLEQMIVTGNDALRISANDFRKEIDAANREISEILKRYNRKNEIEGRNTIKIP